MQTSFQHVIFKRPADIALQHLLSTSFDHCRSHAKLERALDWLLAIYKVALPILVSLAENLVGGHFIP